MDTLPAADYVLHLLASQCSIHGLRGVMPNHLEGTIKSINLFFKDSSSFQKIRRN